MDDEIKDDIINSEAPEFADTPETGEEPASHSDYKPVNRFDAIATTITIVITITSTG